MYVCLFYGTPSDSTERTDSRVMYLHVFRVQQALEQLRAALERELAVQRALQEVLQPTQRHSVRQH